MMFRQLFDQLSGTYSYLLASRPGGEALIIDPVLEKVDRYLQLVKELDLKLVKAVDTHLHADHITGLGALRDRTHCITVMGEQTKADVVSMRLGEGDKLTIEGLALDVIYTPGHTDDSYSFVMPDRVFTGDTLLIRGTGRTDFQNGDPRQQYESIFGRLLKLPDATLVYPAHDYKGDTVSTIGEERVYNPRLQVTSVDEYVDLMNNLKLPNPKMMDVAVPANMKVGLVQEEIARRGCALSAAEALAPSASARPWRCRRRRTRASPRPAISKGASTHGRKPAGRWRVNRGTWPLTGGPHVPPIPSVGFGDCSLTTCFAGRPASFSLGGGNANWGRREPPASARGVRRTKCDFRWISAVHTSLAVDRSADYSSATPSLPLRMSNR
jgi:glyoxylase-like metal-dependent hydrolase (beta-lactamase superfamily II)